MPRANFPAVSPEEDVRVFSLVRRFEQNDVVVQYRADECSSQPAALKPLD